MHALLRVTLGLVFYHIYVKCIVSGYHHCMWTKHFERLIKSFIKCHLHLPSSNIFPRFLVNFSSLGLINKKKYCHDLTFSLLYFLILSLFPSLYYTLRSHLNSTCSSCPRVRSFILVFHALTCLNICCFPSYFPS